MFLDDSTNITPAKFVPTMVVHISPSPLVWRIWQASTTSTLSLVEVVT